jgi:hypothetical protein
MIATNNKDATKEITPTWFEIVERVKAGGKYGY